MPLGEQLGRLELSPPTRSQGLTQPIKSSAVVRTVSPLRVRSRTRTLAGRVRQKVRKQSLERKEWVSGHAGGGAVRWVLGVAVQ